MRAHFHREIGALDDVFEFTGRFAATHGLDEPAVYALRLGVEEIFTNIVKYGGSGEHDIVIELGVDDGELVIEIVDEGSELFDPTAAPAPDTGRPLEARREGGLGIHLIRSVMDYMNYEYRDGTARVVMRKRLEGNDV